MKQRVFWLDPKDLILRLQPLEARMHQRLGRQRQHDHGRHRERAECHGATIDDDRDQNHRRHEERTLGRDVGAGQQQIKGGGGQRRGRRPLLDRKCQAALAGSRQAADLSGFI